MKTKLFILALIFTLSPISSAYAGSGHSHGHGHGSAISKEAAIIAASDNISSIMSQKIEIKGNKLDKSWSDIPSLSKAVYRKGDGYYIISLENKAQGKILYVLISGQGEFYDANFSGAFEGLK